MVVSAVLIEIDGGVFGFTIILILLDVALLGEAHPKFEVITQVTESLLFNALEAKVAELVPALMLFTFH